MHRVCIFTTDGNAAQFEPFEHGEKTFAFAHLESAGPKKLVEGECWAFVDWMMDDLSGLEMVRRLRADQRMRDAHITMVLEEDDLEDRRRAIKAGADDYAIAPLNREAMLDRVLALYGSAPMPMGEREVVHGDLAIRVGTEEARWKGERIPLRPNEFRLLRYLAENPDQILSRQDLIDALGKEGDPDYLRTVDVWIKRLRFGLRHVDAQHLLRTVHGRGYIFDRP